MKTIYKKTYVSPKICVVVVHYDKHLLDASADTLKVESEDSSSDNKYEYEVGW